MPVQFEEQEPNSGPTQPHLAKQDAATVDPSQLTALTPEVVCSSFAIFGVLMHGLISFVLVLGSVVLLFMFSGAEIIHLFPSGLSFDCWRPLTEYNTITMHGWLHFQDKVFDRASRLPAIQAKSEGKENTQVASKILGKLGVSWMSFSGVLWHVQTIVTL